MPIIPRKKIPFETLQIKLSYINPLPHPFQGGWIDSTDVKGDCGRFEGWERDRIRENQGKSNGQAPRKKERGLGGGTPSWGETDTERWVRGKL